MMVCTNCGRTFPDHMKFCQKCGAPLVPSGTEAAPTPQDDGRLPRSPRRDPAVPRHREMRGRRSRRPGKALTVFCVVLAGVLLIGGAAAFIVWKLNQRPSSSLEIVLDGTEPTEEGNVFSPDTSAPAASGSKQSSSDLPAAETAALESSAAEASASQPSAAEPSASESASAASPAPEGSAEGSPFSGSSAEESSIPEPPAEEAAAISPGAAFQAYLELLERERKAIDAYTWQMGYYGYGTQTKEQIPHPVVFCDITGDAVPEMIYVRQMDGADYAAFLQIVTYEDGGTRVIFSRMWDPQVAGGEQYCFYQLKGERQLCVYLSTGDDWWKNTYYVFEEAADGSLELHERLQKYTHHGDTEETYSATYYEYYRNGESISESEYLQEQEAIRSAVSSVLLYNKGAGDFADTFVAANGCPAMTCDEAIAWLGAQLSAEPSAAASAAPANAEDPRTPAAASESGEAISMTADEQYRVNLFLSNFSEQGAFVGEGFDHSSWKVEDAVGWVFVWCKINRQSAVKSSGDGSYYTLTLDEANGILSKYLDIKLTEAQVSGLEPGAWGGYSHYASGTLYFIAADGETYPYFTVVTRLERLPDGTYRATFRNYLLDYEIYFDKGIETKYYRLTAAEAQERSELTLHASGVAILRGIEENGIRTYQLISYRLTD